MAIRRTISILFLFSALTMPLGGQDTESETIPAEIQAIDPFAEDAGDFLDLDLMKVYGMKAYEAYDAEDYETSARYYLAYLAYDISEGGAIYNLACCYGPSRERRTCSQIPCSCGKGRFR